MFFSVGASTFKSASYVDRSKTALLNIFCEQAINFVSLSSSSLTVAGTLFYFRRDEVKNETMHHVKGGRAPHLKLLIFILPVIKEFGFKQPQSIV